MPYEFTVQVDSSEDADDVRPSVRKYRRVYRRPCRSEQPQITAKATGGMIWWKSHRSTQVTLGRVFKRTPEGLLVQNGETTEFVTDKSGSTLAGMSKEEAASLAAKFWWMGLSGAQKASIRREFARMGAPLPLEYGG